MLEQPPPPQPRKKPQQSRSQHMVTAILDACLKILSEHGEQALTLPLLEHVSGAGKGSIYQYFPSLEAIVAALYERECQTAIRDTLAQLTSTSSHPEMTLESLLEDMIESSVTTHERLRLLHSSFHNRYGSHYDIGKIYGESYGVLNFVEDYFVPLIRKEYPDASFEEAKAAGFFLLQGIKSQFFTALELYPEKICDPDFQAYLIKIGVWILCETLKPGVTTQD
ncbi:TetR/AcrR family transcriptional regulator [Pseudomaricurvus alkylphenolicus]|uniref:TetR/AcrR family transcriptional regulator n=1 Tax=Pseudomaricurvus alkylphenolicus TaxID=1306991 RepID=UPI00141DD4F8|nr:TetR/AcrR family transcriptional regulator [Pseudomaricurvus alkylphenolicus]NIB44068.1 TetR/AcrR family transcriptional regulator [Pseudomaricurvus alkylphenolicus]